jgi:2TM domain
MAATEDDRYRAAKSRVAQLRGFYVHLTTFIVVNAFLLVLNLLTDADNLWFYWVLLGWGIGLVAHALQVYGSFTIFGKDWEERKVQEYLKRDERSSPQP